MVTVAPTHPAINLANQNFMKAFNSDDATGVSRCYTEDGQILPPQSEPIVGWPGIEAFWRMVMDMGIKSATLETVEVIEYPGGAFEVGRYRLATADGQMVDRGKYLVVWREEDGAMKLYRDIWNTSLAPST
jgi:ketosteroid isomerase-like protein